jgi:ABC-type sugar transport system permease subunit
VRAIVGDAVFQQSLVNTVLFTIVAVVLLVGIGFGLAVLVADQRRGRTLLRLVFFAPFVLAPVAVGAVWSYLYAPFFGIVPVLGDAIGVDAQTVAPLSDARTALWAILIAFVWRFTGFAMVIYLAGMQNLPREYQEHALLEGASRGQRLRSVSWPLLWPQTFVIVLLATIGSLRMFDMVWVMTEGGPAHATETVATNVYTTAFRFLDIGYAQAMAMVLLVVILLTSIMEYRLLDRRAQDTAT